MNENFFDFVKTPDRQLFMRSRAQLVQLPEYNAYSDDLKKLDGLLAEGKFDEALEHRSYNLILSPRAQMLYAFAYANKGMEKEEKASTTIGSIIMDNILLTGNGSKEQPYFVTRIDDERDVLMALGERFTSQVLINEENRVLDCISTVSGNKVYFDITDCYASIAKFSLDNFLENTKKPSNTTNTHQSTRQKKWWQFWK